MDWAVFIVSAIAVLAGAIGVVTSRNPVHAALMLVMTLFGVAILFVEQQAHFLAVVQVIVYAGAIVVFMCVELMLNAVNLTLLTFSRMHGDLTGQVIAFFTMVVAAAEVVVGLAIIVSVFRTRRSASVDDANLLKY